MHHFKKWVLSRLALSFLFIFFLNFSFNLLARDEEKEKDPPSSYKATSLREIVEFKDISPNYTLGYGYDETGRNLVPLAIYDKTFPNLGNKKQLLRLILASVGIGDFNLNKAVEKIKNHRKKKKRKIIKEFVVGDILRSEGDKTKKIVYPSAWWKNPELKWKKSCRALFLKENPDRIPLDCLVVKKSFLRDKIAKKIHNLLVRSLFEEDTWSEVRRASYFYRQDDGNYELIVSEKEKQLAPTKIIDLRGYNTSFKKAYAWSIQTTVLKTGIGQIPFAVVPQIIVSILENLFNYIEVVNLFQQSEALTLLIEAHHGNNKSPFYGYLPEQDLKHAIRYLRRGEVFLSSVFRNLFQKKEHLAEKYLQKSAETAEKNYTYLEKKGYDLIRLGESYAFASKESKKGEITELKIFSLLKRKTFRRRPHTVVDFLNPKKEYAKRNILNGILIGSNFVYVAIPIVPSILRILFKELFIREMQRYQAHEAGFRSFTDYHRDEIREAFDKKGIPKKKVEKYLNSIYKIIKLRSLNPLILDQEEREERRKQSENWMSAHYEHYRPY